MSSAKPIEKYRVTFDTNCTTDVDVDELRIRINDVAKALFESELKDVGIHIESPDQDGIPAGNNSKIRFFSVVHAKSEHTGIGAATMALQQSVMLSRGQVEGWIARPNADWTISIGETSAELIHPPLERTLTP